MPVPLASSRQGFTTRPIRRFLPPEGERAHRAAAEIVDEDSIAGRRVTLSSAPGRGTTAMVVLPRA